MQLGSKTKSNRRSTLESARSNPSTEIRVASLFSGIGGFDHALEMAGAAVVFQCESDAYCRAVLKRHWPEAILDHDIRILLPEDIPDADIWTAGFPCQDVSLARGNHGRTGLKGHHTSLFFRLASLMAVKRPKVVLLENVAGLLNSHRGQDFAIILRELTKLGYAVSWRLMNARYFGSPQSRSRVFLCAWRDDYRGALSSLFEKKPGASVGNQRAAFVTPCLHKATGAIVPEIAYCVAATSGRHTGNDWSRSYICYTDAVRRPTPTESERLQGFPPHWTIPHESFPPPARGLDSDRYKAIGNAVAIPVVSWIAKRMVAEMSASRRAPSSSDTPAAIQRLAPDLKQSASLLDFEAIEAAIDAGSFERHWQAGGCAWENFALEGSASPAPSKVIRSMFVDALDERVPDERYFLTPNAALGVLRRADSVGRNLFEPMRKALENLVRKGIGPATLVHPRTGDSLAKSSLRPPRAEQCNAVQETGGGRPRRLSA